jgi:hypothetical protein
MDSYRGVQKSPNPEFYSPTFAPVMLEIDSNRNYPFKHTHRNLFPPQPRPLSNVYEEEEFPIFFEESDEGDFTGFGQFTGVYTIQQPVVSIEETLLSRSMSDYPRPLKTPRRPALENLQQVQHTPDNTWRDMPTETPVQTLLDNMKLEPYVFPALKEYPAFTPPLACPPPFILPIHTDTGKAPVATVTNLLQDVLGIMNTVMSEQGRVEEESEIFAELVELVAIMQQEAEALVEMVDLVEEYVEEVDTAAELEQWVQDLENIRSPSPWPITFHERDDSGISMGEGTDSGIGDYDEMGGGSKTSRVLREEDLYRDPVIHDPAIHTEEHRRDPENQEVGVKSVQKAVPSRRPKKGKKKKREPEFRDSALGLLSPAGQRRPISTNPRWI